MTARRPGAPRRAGRPVAPSPRKTAGRSGARSTPRQGATSQSGATSSSRPAGAARRRTTPLPVAADQEGPAWGITRRGLVLIALVVVALATLVPALNSYVSQRQQLSAARAQVAEKQAQVQELQHRVDRWEDPNFVAAQARERLLYAMPGETQYRLTDTSGQDVPLTEKQKVAEAAAQEDWYDSLWTSVEASSRLQPQDVPDATTTERTGGSGAATPTDQPTTAPAPTTQETATP